MAINGVYFLVIIDLLENDFFFEGQLNKNNICCYLQAT